MARKARTDRKLEDYSGLSDITHVYKIPDTYIGGCRKSDFKTYVYEDEKLVEKTLNIPQGVVRLFYEPMSNAGDNADASRRAGIDPEKLVVNIDKKRITIQNFGLHIPVKKITLKEEKGETKVEEFDETLGLEQDFTWLPVFIFGKFRSSNNYDTSVIRMGCGRNGFGAKLTNIFSKEFVVEVEDPESKMKLRAVWKDNMFKDTPGKKPEVEVSKNSKIKKGSVTISWVLDFDRFSMKEYSEDEIKLFFKCAIDFSFTCKLKLVFNGEELDFRSIKSYASLLWTEEQLNNSITKYTWHKDAPEEITKSSLRVQEKKIRDAKNPEHIPELEILVIDTSDSSKNVSYVNGLTTVEGGTHLEAAQEPICKHIIGLVIGNKKKSKKDKNPSITIKNIKPHLSFLVNARIGDPEYTSQSKTRMAAPQMNVSFTEGELKKIQDWDVIKRMYAELDAIAFKSASNSDGKKKKHIVLDCGEDANDAGTKKSKDCVISVVEGKSAANYPQKRICLLPGGKDKHGYMCLRGKFLNVTNAKATKYAANAVISSLKQTIGLREGIDYNLEFNVNTLRYGFILIQVDADDDGMHIMAHVLNFLREKFPGIIKRNMVGYLRTPIIKIFKKDKIVHRFFNKDSFNTWMKSNSPKGLTIRYYKGLGTSSDDDIVDDLDHAPTIVCFHDDKCIDNFNLAFHGDNSDQRKEWIEKWRDVTNVEDIMSVDISKIKSFAKLFKAQDISQFLNRELIGYSVASLIRAIPSEYDHLKDSQRKALYSALDFFGYDPKKGKSIKVGRFANKAADMTQYHHGEKSLTDTFIKMAQDFMGSNNMGFFKKDGQFGTRADGGDNAADARYSETHLAWWIPFVFQKESIDIIKRRIIDDEECEPEWLPGVIPMGIVNGTNGIATAYSTSTPSHNPLDVIKWYKNKCLGKEPKPIAPWYNGFTGKYKVVDRNKNETENENENEEMLPGDINVSNPISSPRRIEDIEDMEDENISDMDIDNLAILNHVKNSKLTLKTFGKYDIIGLHKNEGPIIKITELPVRTWMYRYRKWLELLISEGSGKKEKAIYDFKDNCTTEKVDFEIHWNNKYKIANHASLRLTRSLGLSNITLIDHKGFPTRFPDIQSVMEKYYEHMIKHYEDVRESRINIEVTRVTDISYKMKFIVLVLKKEIAIIKVKEDTIKEKMKEHSIPFEYYDKSKSRDFSEESLEKYKKQLEECKAREAEAKKTTAKEIWLCKLKTLEKELRKRYKDGILNMKK